MEVFQDVESVRLRSRVDGSVGRYLLASEDDQRRGRGRRRRPPPGPRAPPRRLRPLSRCPRRHQPLLGAPFCFWPAAGQRDFDREEVRSTPSCGVPSGWAPAAGDGVVLLHDKYDRALPARQREVAPVPRRRRGLQRRRPQHPDAVGGASRPHNSLQARHPGHGPCELLLLVPSLLAILELVCAKDYIDLSSNCGNS
ncbi:Os08g0163700 [Oryza sativa Japonica Group]|uniref:Uncharacterized protein n=2 Tax=Oryza sativa subsp. japonica TaxID=39947 RepID=A0A0P0XCB3_ORYSJ|nr:hypothetical protein EE612_042299 [Oryza sativa]BAC99814.1 hypothetical protein [Oryza sativa Japonica Group]BAC99911.1 hypothetical protein [Oryza sativa Japonica Group]BAT03968.1 Os08g0163700 [Oryza sativa Japonica Group]